MSSNASAGWIPVSSRLPEIGVMVDIWSHRGRVADCSVYYVDGQGIASWDNQFGMYEGSGSVTHWMEIPGSPYEEDTDAAQHRPE